MKTMIHMDEHEWLEVLHDRYVEILADGLGQIEGVDLGHHQIQDN